MTFTYNIKAHETTYAGVVFRSRLEAKWAAFFDLAKWKWQYEPLDLVGWTPDFLVTFPCKHSDCNGSHTLLVEVKPFTSIEQFKGHPCRDYPFGHKNGVQAIPADASAAFGLSPDVTHWEMGHGAGGGDDHVPFWVPNWNALWREAGNITKWLPSPKFTTFTPDESKIPKWLKKRKKKKGKTLVVAKRPATLRPATPGFRSLNSKAMYEALEDPEAPYFALVKSIQEKSEFFLSKSKSA